MSTPDPKKNSLFENIIPQGEEIERIMRRTGLSLQQLGERAGIKETTLKRVIKGWHQLSPAGMKAMRLIEVMEVGASRVAEDPAAYGEIRPNKKAMEELEFIWQNGDEGICEMVQNLIETAYNQVKQRRAPSESPSPPRKGSRRGGGQ